MSWILKAHVVLRTASGFPDDERFWPSSQIGGWLGLCTLMLLGGLAHRHALPLGLSDLVEQNLRPIAFFLWLFVYGGTIVFVRTAAAYPDAECWFAELSPEARRGLIILLPLFGIVSFVGLLVWFLWSL